MLCGAEDHRTLVFRGTSLNGEELPPFNLFCDALRDLRCWPWPVKILGQTHHGHAGFIRGACRVVKHLRPELGKGPVTCTGHSLGGAIALVAGLKLAKEGRSVMIVTFGAPKVFLRGVKLPENVEISMYRAGKDLVTYLPIGKHPVKPCKIGSPARFWPNLSDHSMDRYVEALQLIQRG